MPTSYRRFYTLAGAIILLFSIYFFSSNFLEKQNDFRAFYDSGVAVIKGDNIYCFKDNTTGMPTMLPPFASLVFALFALLPVKLTAWIYNVLKLIGIFYLIKFLYMYLHKVGKKEKILLSIIFLLCFKYFLNDFKLGQINTFQVIFLILFFDFIIKRKILLSIIFLTLAYSFKPTPLYLLILIFTVPTFKDKIKFAVYTGIFIMFLHIIMPISIYGYKNTFIFSKSYYEMAIKPNTKLPQLNSGNLAVQVIPYKYLTNSEILVEEETNEKIKINFIDLNIDSIKKIIALLVVGLALVLIYFQVRYPFIDKIYFYSFAIITMTLSTTLIKNTHEVILLVPIFVVLYYFYYTDKCTFKIISFFLIALTLLTSQDIVGKSISQRLAIYGIGSIKYIILYIAHLVLFYRVKQGK